MPIRVEWNDNTKTILTITLRERWNPQESSRILNEWVRPILAQHSAPLGVVLDLRDSNMTLSEAQRLLDRLRALPELVKTYDRIAVVGLPSLPDEPDILQTDGVAAAAARLSFMLRKQVAIA